MVEKEKEKKKKTQKKTIVLTLFSSTTPPPQQLPRMSGMELYTLGVDDFDSIKLPDSAVSSRRNSIDRESQREPSTSRSSSRRRFSIAERDAVPLPAVDRGKGAYIFLLNAFVLEMVIWGYSFSFGIIQVYLSSHAPFNTSSIEAISAVGTIALAIQYVLPAFCMVVFRRYPEKVKGILYIATAVSSGSMLLSSWATSVWQLIILQGILGGTSGAVLYTPVLMWLQDWFLERRGCKQAFSIQPVSLLFT